MKDTAIDDRVGDEARTFISAGPKMLIDGSFVGALSGRTIDVFDPSTGALLVRVPEAGTDDVNLAVAAARRAFDGTWSVSKPAERSRLLWALADLLERHASEFADYEALDSSIVKTMLPEAGKNPA